MPAQGSFGLTETGRSGPVEALAAAAEALADGPLATALPRALARLEGCGVRGGALYELRAGVFRAVAGEPTRAQLEARLAEVLLRDGAAAEGARRYVALRDRKAVIGAVELTVDGRADEALVRAAASLFGLALRLGGGRELETQLVESGRMAALGELAAGVAHEINNPLFAILGLVEFLLADTEAGTKAHQRLTLIQASGNEIRETVRALLDFARDRTGEEGVLSLEELVRETVDLARRTSLAKGVEFVERYAAEGAVVEGSPGPLRQVLYHLVANAQQAMRSGGTVTVQVAREGGWLVTSVRDTGPGIRPEVMPHIFEPFFTTRRGEGGTGLGLAVARTVARMHGGELSVRSVPGEGACFTLRLPVFGGAP